MSNRWVTWAYEQKGLKTGEKFVLVVLADHADETGYCYPSQERMAEHTEMSSRSVQTHCNNLEAKGLVGRDKTQVKGSNYYRYEYHLKKLPENSSTGKKQQELPENSAQNHRKILPNNPYPEPSIEPPLSFDDLEKEWKKLGLTPKTESFAKAVKVWHMLTDEEKQQAIVGCKPFQQQYRRENSNDIRMLGVFRYLDERRFKDFCKQPKLPEGTMLIRRGEEGWDEWVEHKVLKSGNPMARKLYLPGGQFADKPMLVTSQYPPGTNVSRETASPETWRSRVVRHRENGEWSSNWGPKPGEAGCLAPDEPRRQSA